MTCWKRWSALRLAYWADWSRLGRGRRVGAHRNEGQRQRISA
jgi:hypothetical protein